MQRGPMAELSGSSFQKVENTVQTRCIPVTVTTENLRVKVKRRSDSDSRIILKDVNFCAQPGELVAIVGPSGCGKTTLLNCIAKRKTDYDGKVLFNGVTAKLKDTKQFLNYVMAQDRLLPYLTVWECIKICADLRLPHLAKAERLQRAQKVLEDLELSDAKDTYVGGEWRKGLSSGQMRRLSVAIELLDNPSVLLLDEPTTGLDSSLSYELLLVLLRLAHKDNRTIICTLHQPRSQMFDLFDKLVLMTGGRIVYHGQASASVDHFAAIGYVCPPDFNPADFFLELAAEDSKTEHNVANIASSDISLSPNKPVEMSGKRQILPWSHDEVLQLEQLFPETDEGKNLATSLVQAKEGEYAGKLPRKFGSHHVSVCGQASYNWTRFCALYKRTSLNSLRNPLVCAIMLLVQIIQALLLGSLMFQLDSGVAGIEPVQLFPDSLLGSPFMDALAYGADLNGTYVVQNMIMTGVNFNETNPLNPMLNLLYSTTNSSGLAAFLGCARQIILSDVSPAYPPVSWPQERRLEEVSMDSQEWNTYAKDFDDVDPSLTKWFDVDVSEFVANDRVHTIVNPLRYGPGNSRIHPLAVAVTEKVVDLAFDKEFWPDPLTAIDPDHDPSARADNTVSTLVSLMQILDYLISKLDVTPLINSLPIPKDQNFGSAYSLKFWASFVQPLIPTITQIREQCSPPVPLPPDSRNLFELFMKVTTEGSISPKRRKLGESAVPTDQNYRDIAVMYQLFQSASSSEDVGASLPYALYADSKAKIESTDLEDQTMAAAAFKTMKYISQCGTPFCDGLAATLAYMGEELADLKASMSSVVNICGCLFFGVANMGFASYTVLLTFPAERVLVNRESANGQYSMWVFYLAKNLGDLPATIGPNMAMWLIYWAMTGLASEFTRFLMFMVIGFGVSFAAFGLGYLISAAAPRMEVAVVVAPVVLVLMLLTAGFFLRDGDMAAFIAWFRYFSIYRYGLYSCVANQFPLGEYFGALPNDFNRTVGGMSDQTLGQVVSALFGLGLLYRTLGYLCLQFFHRKAGLQAD